MFASQVSRAVVVLTLVSLTDAALAATTAVGSQFQVNTRTASAQDGAAVAVSANGAFVVVWSSYDQDGSKDGVFAQRWTSSGARQSVEFQVNRYTTQSQYGPDVALAGDGRFIVAWHSYGGQDGYQSGVFARRYDANGVAVSAEFQVNTTTASPQSYPAIALDGDGDFVIAWNSYQQDGAFGGIFARRFNSSGAALAVEFQVNGYTTGGQYSPTIGADLAGNFIVAWRDTAGRDGSVDGVFARRFSSAGTALGNDFQVNVYTPSNQLAPDVRVEPAGSFVVSWRSALQDGSDYGVFARRFGASGTPVTAELQVNVYTPGSQGDPSVALGQGGSFMVTWPSQDQDGSGLGVFSRAFNSTGSPLGPEQQVATHTQLDQKEVSIASDGGTRFVIAWEDGSSDVGLDGSYTGVFAQRLALLATLDVDGDGAMTPLTDGLLVLRYMFGFTGPTLTTGAVGAGCTRCTAAQIEAYLQTLS